jgi:hypothetical protein
MKKYFEFVQDDFEPIKSFYLKDKLNDKVWDEFDLNDDIREKLLKIGTDFFEGTDIKTDIIDIVLCGSLCNYNWSEKYSDYDLHIIVNFSDIDDNSEISEKLCDYAKKLWNSQHDIKIKGYDVEVAIQDSEDLQKSISAGRMGGVYSLLHDEWIKKPQKIEFEPDEKLIRMKAETIMSSIDELDMEEDYAKFKEKIDKAWKKIKESRKSGLESESGEFSIGNLVFKLLRRNGYVDKVVEMKNKSYDKQFESLSEDDIIKLLYFIEDINKKYRSVSSEGNSQYIQCEYDENEDYIDINYGWSTYEEGSNEDMRVFYKETPIRVEWVEEGSSVYGDYDNKNDYKFNSIDELISFIKNKYVDDEY